MGRRKMCQTLHIKGHPNSKRGRGYECIDTYELALKLVTGGRVASF